VLERPDLSMISAIAVAVNLSVNPDGPGCCLPPFGVRGSRSQAIPQGAVHPLDAAIREGVADSAANPGTADLGELLGKRPRSSVFNMHRRGVAIGAETQTDPFAAQFHQPLQVFGQALPSPIFLAGHRTLVPLPSVAAGFFHHFGRQAWQAIECSSPRANCSPPSGNWSRPRGERTCWLAARAFRGCAASTRPSSSRIAPGEPTHDLDRDLKESDTQRPFAAF